MSLVSRQIQVENRVYNIQVPDQCPICHRHSETAVVTADKIDSGSGVQVTLRCAYINCRQFFFAYYGPVPSGELKNVRPIRPQLTAFSDAVRTVSPMFVSVFQEAEEAAANGLHQISGPGFRKSFEFLIKDYAKTLAPDKAKEIESKFSGAVVNDYIPDKRIQGVAKRCLWLGNDESHYLRKWTQHDVSDLVALIRLVAHWIDIEQLSKSYVQDMPE